MRTSVTLSPQFLEDAGELVRRRTGLVFYGPRRASFEAALVRAMHRAPPSPPEAYLASLDAHPAILDQLVADITVGETYFFRHPQQFAVIRDEIVPALASRRRGEDKLRIWSAGCATGEEAFTLAIVLQEAGLADAAHIVATDLSRTALAKARRGLYTRWSLRGVPDHVTRTYLERAGERFQLTAAVRDVVELRYLNLAEDAFPSPQSGIWGMDLILCRNVLIYFDAETVARVARQLIDSLSDDGWLLLGASDPMLGDLARCEVVVTEAGLAYRRAGKSIARPTLRPPAIPACPPPLAPPAPQPPAASTAASPPPRPAPPRPAERQPLEDSAQVFRAYAERDYDRTAELGGRLVQRDGSDPRVCIALVRALANRGELKAAGQACAAALDRHRGSAELSYLHAVLLSEGGRHSEAADAARRALYLDRGLVVSHLALGGALARLGDSEGARRALRNAHRLLAGMPAGAIVPASDGEPAGRLAEMTRARLELLQERTTS